MSVEMSQERSSHSNPVQTDDSGEMEVERKVPTEVHLQETSPHIQLQSAEILAMTAGEEELLKEEETSVVTAEDYGTIVDTTLVGATLNDTTTESGEARVNRPPPGVSKQKLSPRSQKSSKGVPTTRNVRATSTGTTTEAGEEGVNRSPAAVTKRELSSRSQMSSRGVATTTSEFGPERQTSAATVPGAVAVSGTTASGSEPERQASAATVPGAVAVSGNSARNDAENSAPSSTIDDDFDYVSSPPPLTATVTATAISVEELEDEMRDRILGQPVQAFPEPMTPIENNDSKTISRQRKLLYVLVCACVTVVAVVSIILATRDDSVEKKPKKEKPLPPPRTILQDELLRMLTRISADNGLALKTPMSPQSKAFHWLADSNFTDFSPDELTSRYAMAVLYHSTDGPKWGKQDLWLSNSSICDWYGDTPLSHCFGGSFRRQLILNNNNLKGSLPPELALLGENLKELDLSFNSLTGSIPLEIARLTGLTRLILQGNSLTGSAIPLEMSTLTRLRVFDVNLNRDLAGSLPPEMGAWTDLRDFTVESTNMNGAIPSAIGKWTSLERWHSRRVKWDGTIPTEFGLMVSLKELDMAGAGGSIYGPIPEAIYKITSLTWLSLTRTGVQGTISTAIGQLTSLDRLHLGINRLKGTIPSQIEKLTLLRELLLNSQVSVDDYP